MRKRPTRSYWQRWIAFGVFLFVCGLLPDLAAQTISTDSLEQQFASEHGARKARALNELISTYIRSDARKAEEKMVYVREWAGRETDTETLAYLELAYGVYFGRTGKIDSSIYYFERAQEHATQVGSNHALVRAHSGLGTSYVFSGKPKQGLDHMFEGLRIVEKVFPDKELEMRFHTNIAWAYLELKQFDDCIRQGLYNIRVMEGTEYEWVAMYTYNNIAVCYGASGKLDSARFYIEKGIRTATRNNDYQSLANAYFILGTIYSEAGKYDLAIEQYLKARPFREKVGNPVFIVSDLYTLADLYAKKRDYRKGIETAKEALALAEKYNLQMKYDWTYLSLAENYEGMGDFRNASKYYRMWAVAKDTMYKHASADAIAEMQTRYNTEKKEQQIALKNAQLSEQSARLDQTYTIIGALTTTIVLIIVIFLLLRSRQRRKRELSLREAQIQATIESQETERRRFAQDLHDGMGQLISALRLALHRIHSDTPLEERVNIASRAEGLLNDMHKEIRTIAFNLMPQTLVQHGLVPALKEMSTRINDSGRIALRITSFDVPDRLDGLLEISLYRVIQEWVNNIVKYAEASVIEVQLVGYQDEINVTIEDDGNGFDATVLENAAGNGWKNIRSRINLVKASLDIDSLQGRKGTTLMVRVPLTKAVVSEAPVPSNTTQHGYPIP